MKIKNDINWAASDMFSLHFEFISKWRITCVLILLLTFTGILSACSKNKIARKFAGDYEVSDLITYEPPDFFGYNVTYQRQYYIIVQAHPQYRDSIVIHQFAAMGYAMGYVNSYHNQKITAYADGSNFYVPEQHPISTDPEISKINVGPCQGNFKKDSIFYDFYFTAADSTIYHGTAKGKKFPN